MPSPIHHLTSPGQLTAATVVCGARDAALGSWDLQQVTCPACQRGPCTCGPGRPLCPACRTWNAAHRDRPTTAPALKTEKQFQEALRQRALAAGFLYYHVHDSRHSPAGFPDTVLVHPARGLAVFAELKLPGKRPTPPQQRWLDALAQVERVVTRLWRPDDWGEIEETLS